MNNTTKNWFRAALGIRQLCEVKLDDDTWCGNKAVYGVGMYSGPHIVVCANHYEVAKMMLEISIGVPENKDVVR